MKKARNLQNSLFFSFASATLIPIALVAMVIINHLFVTTLNEISAKNRILAMGVSSQIEVFLAKPLTILANIGTMLKNPAVSDHVSSQFILDSHVKNSDLFDAIYLLDQNFSVKSIGLHDGKEAYRDDYTGINLAHKQFIQKAFTSRKPQWSETFMSMISGKMNISACIPLENSILVADINIVHLAGIINGLAPGGNITTTVIDNHGAIIIHPDPEIVARQVMLSNIDLVAQALSGRERADRFTLNDIKSIGATRIIPTAGWVVLVSQPLKEAYQPVYRTLLLLGAGILVSVIMAFLFSMYKARQLSRPLAELTRHTTTIAGGDYKFFLPSTEYEEVRELSFSISQMASAINFREQLLIESEQKFREVITATDNLITRVDRNGKFTFVNPAAQKLYGLSLEDLLGRSAFEYIHPDDRNRTRMAFEKWKRERRKSVAYENRQIGKDGEIHHLLWTINIHYDQNGMMTEASSIGNDISSRFEAEEQKRQFEEHILHAQKMEAIGTLAGGIAHDFNNILTAIIGYTELTLFTSKPSPEICSNLDEILKAAHRAKELVKQILAFSRKDESVKKPINMVPLVRESLKMLRASIPTTIEIREEIHQDCGLVLADPTKIHQLIMNLCTNAYQAMRETGGILTVSLSRVDASEIRNEQGHSLRTQDHLKLTVSDTGSGIDPTIRDKIFEPFFTTKPQGEGTGMGLSVVHGIVLSHEGHTEVESSPGSGATFTILLPVLAGEDCSPEQTASPSYHPGSGHVVVVDDEKAITDFVRRSLTSMGYTVTAFNKPEEALAFLRDDKNPADILLTDMTMPNLNGAELAGKTAGCRPNLPIIMFTGFSDLIDEAKAGGYGIGKFITKPFDIHQITEAIKELLNKP
ncbi:MAG: PAS domain S-box protein [Proteobacteria bacterium]|nr:PAS domain S-box protein [Pseudomonadota bacterium]MBU1736973.1 PAS domain S-box protein [Pseudomonadota bacterium]